MKKIFLLSSLFVIISAFGYTSEDTSNANYLADQGIVTKQTVASKYRLDDKILRQEVIGMALKVKGVTLPENYTCKKYFADATKNDWVCRAVELAADNGIISRSNKYANPGKSITRAEALAMIISQYNIDPFPEVSPEGNTWQQEVARKYIGIGVDNRSSSDGFIIKDVIEGMGFTAQWSPNRLATRAEVFAFAKSILSQDNNGYCEVEGAKVSEPCEITFTQNMGSETYEVYTKTIRFGDYVERDIDGYKGPECSLSYLPGSIQDGVFFFGGPSYWQISTKGGKIDAIDLSYEVPATLIFGQDGYYFAGLTNECAQNITFSNIRKIKDSDILVLYYKKIKEKDIYFSYYMRSPAGVSLATFESWYKNTESVIFREDTLKSLGDNTYEFLVDMTEGGVKSTYKVKSKVNLEKFTIDNISSVKQ